MLNSPAEEIKNRLDVVEVIGSYIKLQKVGANYRAVCPFHSEKKPSFFVSPSRQMWHCFGACSTGGDIFKFVMKIEGLEFPDALKMLAQRAGVELKKASPQSARLRSEKERLYAVSELAAKFFEKQLESKIGQQAKKYLLDRGISQESIKKWRLGYAPNNWQGLSDFLIGRGYKEKEIMKVGLIVRKEGNNKTFDRFRSRIMFPIFDLNSKVVGFTGRIFGESKEVAKYVNTPNTALYDKSRILYGLDKAKVVVRKQNKCILVEGQTDVIMSHQAGVENAVATSGTALTSFQLAILKRYSDNLITAFDMDIAGDSATKRGINLAQSQGFDIRVIIMLQGKDPADIVSENPENWKDLVDKAESITDFYFKTAFSKYDAETPEGKKEISKILLPVFKRMPNKIEQAHWIQKLAEKIGIKEEAIETEMKKTREEKLDYFPEQTTNAAPVVKSRKQMLEERILSLVLKSPQNLSLVNQAHFSLFSNQTKAIFTDFRKEPNLFINRNVSPEVKDFLNELCFRAEMGEEEVDVEEDIETCLREMQSLCSREELDRISQEIKKAEQEKDSQKVNSLTGEFHKLFKELNNLSEDESLC